MIHIAQTKTKRSGSSAALNFSSKSSFTKRLRCGSMSRPRLAIRAISFCEGLTTTAMSVFVSQSSCSCSAARSTASVIVATRFVSAREHFVPMAANLVIHADRGRLVDGDEHRLAAIATPREMPHQIGGDLLQPVIVGDQLILLGEALRESASSSSSLKSASSMMRAISSPSCSLVRCSSGRRLS